MFNEILSFFSNFILMFKELLLILVGGLCAAFGGFLAMWYQVKKSREIRREQIIAEKEVEVCSWAALQIYELQGKLMGNLSNAIQFMDENNKFFMENILFFPKEFRDKWGSIRVNLNKANSLEEEIKKQPNNKKEAELHCLQVYLDKLAKEAEKAILDKIRQPPINIERFSESTKVSNAG
jgi:hypothetical protein